MIGNLTKLFRGLEPDVVHTHQIGALIYAGLSARRAGTPVIVHTEHGKHYQKSWKTRWLGRLAARFAQRFFCVSRDIASAAIRHRVAPADKVEVIPNGISVASFRNRDDALAARESLGIPIGAPVLGTVGRLSEVKRQDVLIRGFALIHNQLPAAHLVIVGDGPLMSELRTLARSVGVERNVHFTGYQASPQRYLHAMDVFALTSRSEGMPLGVLEAWAAGIAVIASAVGGLPELIGEGETGLLFPFPDEALFAEKARKLLVDREVRARIGEVGRQRVETLFTTEHMARNYHQRYLHLLRGAGQIQVQQRENRGGMAQCESSC